MHVTGGGVSVHHPAHHRTRSRLTLQGYTATTTRILRQLAGDHRTVAMMLLVPSLIITLMYFMFQNVPTRPGMTSGFNNACLILLGVFPLLVSSHVMDEADRCGDLLLMRDGHLLAHITPTQLREDTGCTSLEEAFLSIIRRTTAPAAG